MDEMAMHKRVLKGKLYATRTGRPGIRRMDDVTDDIRRMGNRRWMEKARNREQWRLRGGKVHPGLLRRAAVTDSPQGVVLHLGIGGANNSLVKTHLATKKHVPRTWTEAMRKGDEIW